jgi:hypothetical protein
VTDRWSSIRDTPSLLAGDRASIFAHCIFPLSQYVGGGIMLAPIYPASGQGLCLEVIRSSFSSWPFHTTITLHEPAASSQERCAHANAWSGWIVRPSDYLPFHALVWSVY